MSDAVEKVARALCRADGKDPDGWYEFGTCAGRTRMRNWEFHYPFMALKAMTAMQETVPRIPNTADPDINVFASYYIGPTFWHETFDAALS